MDILCHFLKQVGPKKEEGEASRLEKGGKGGKSPSSVGKNLKMLIESTRLFGTQEYILRRHQNFAKSSSYF